MRLSPFGSPGSSPNSALVFIPGALLVTIGLSILLLPELLRYLVAGFFVLVGALLLGAAWQLRRGPITTRMAGFLDRFRDDARR
ncbi:MAG: hypothetical protein U1F36_07085 [Planctomycetota bacterium]